MEGRVNQEQIDLIATKVMGWKRQHACGIEWWADESFRIISDCEATGVIIDVDDFNPYECWGSAGMVWDKLVELGYRLLAQGITEGCMATWITEDSTDSTGICGGFTEAIAQAALKIAEGGVER
uniref:Phage ABA sandwich domain-containing protein n=1 Tax=viral metagenome TaxID=1070528 RepID=A0A6M3XI82_9ZZZZ